LKNRIKEAWGISNEIAKSFLLKIHLYQEGSILTGIILSVVTIIVLAALIPGLWPMLTASTAQINAINGTDTATVFLKTGWPIAILLIGIGIVIGLIYFALKQFGIIGGGGKRRGGSV